MGETREELLAKIGIGHCGTCIHFLFERGPEEVCVVGEKSVSTTASSRCLHSPCMWNGNEEARQVAIHVRVPIRASVWLPDAVVDDGEGLVTKAARERAWEALMECLPQDSYVYIDGGDEPAAHVFIDPDETEDGAEMWAE